MFLPTLTHSRTVQYKSCSYILNKLVLNSFTRRVVHAQNNLSIPHLTLLVITLHLITGSHSKSTHSQILPTYCCMMLRGRASQQRQGAVNRDRLDGVTVNQSSSPVTIWKCPLIGTKGPWHMTLDLLSVA
jgi:hypothetical protein